MRREQSEEGRTAAACVSRCEPLLCALKQQIKLYHKIHPQDELHSLKRALNAYVACAV